jgi:hypothetical protein
MATRIPRTRQSGTTQPHGKRAFVTTLALIVKAPFGYATVEHDGGTVHAINLDEARDGVPLWRNEPVCGMATGVSSDEAGPEALRAELDITCWECISIVE